MSTVPQHPTPSLRAAAGTGGETICAPAFVGIAGMVLADGAGMLWLPVGLLAGYVVLATLISAPLHRSRARTLGEFVQWRLASPPVRFMTGACVWCTGWLYLLPQLYGAGVTLRAATGAPRWAGGVAVAGGALVVVLRARGTGRRRASARWFWMGLALMAVPAVAMVAVWWSHAGPDPMLTGLPAFLQVTSVVLDLDTVVRVPVDTRVGFAGVLDHERYDGDDVVLVAGTHVIAEGSRLTFPAGAPVPHAEWLPIKDGPGWAMPWPTGDHPLVALGSLLVVLVLGTLGLPHLPGGIHGGGGGDDGRSARRAAALVPVLLSMFLAFPALYGALGRLYTPGLLLTGQVDAVLVSLPRHLLDPPYGEAVSVVLAAGALVAFTASAGAVAGALARTVSPRPSPAMESCSAGERAAGVARARRAFRRFRAFRAARGGGTVTFVAGVVVALCVPAVLLEQARPHGSMQLVLAAFMVAACTLCPLLVLAVWWRGLTAAGAAAGLAVGGGLGGHLALSQILGCSFDGPLMTMPSGLPLPLIPPMILLVMAVASVATRRRIPADADRLMATLHLPDGMLTGR